MNSLKTLIQNGNNSFWAYSSKNQNIKTIIFCLFLISRVKSVQMTLKMLKKWYIKYNYQKVLKQRFGKESWAIITGGSEGIGKQYALQISKLGINVFILSINEEQNIATKQEIESNGVQCQTMQVDFSAMNTELYDIIFKKIEKLQNICLLVNNVGINVFKNLKDMTYEQINNITVINVLPMIILSQKILPLLKKQKHPAIINMSSFAYQLILPQTTIYSASKQSIAKFSEILRDYLKYTDQGTDNTNVQVLNVEPLGISTKFINFQQNFSIITPEQCVRNVLKAVACNEQFTNSHWKHSLFSYLLIKLKEGLPNFESSISQIYYNLIEKKIIQF